MSNEKKIRITANGPYNVSGNIPLKQAKIVQTDRAGDERWESGREYATDKTSYNLCRCGHSQNKPYCDGSHVKNNFNGGETADRSTYTEEAKIYEGETVDLMDNEKLCAVARFCDADPSVWQATMQSGEDGNGETAIRKACSCPSGRLTALKKDGTPIEPDLNQEIDLIEDEPAGFRGPLWVKGGIQLEGADGRAYEIRNRMTLCRCGESENMPFCNASHLRCPHMKGFDR